MQRNSDIDLSFFILVHPKSSLSSTTFSSYYRAFPNNSNSSASIFLHPSNFITSFFNFLFLQRNSAIDLSFFILVHPKSSSITSTFSSYYRAISKYSNSSALIFLQPYKFITSFFNFLFLQRNSAIDLSFSILVFLKLSSSSSTFSSYKRAFPNNLNSSA